MRKEIEVTGINGIFKGFVEVKLNAKKETKKVNNNITHEEENKTFHYHHVGSIYFDSKGNAEILEDRNDILNESEVYIVAYNLEKKLDEKLFELANNTKKSTIEERLKENGYK